MRADGARGGGAGRRRPRDLEAALARLEALDIDGLTAAWRERFEAPPPAALPPRLLLLALAHDLQASAFGGLAAAVERRLVRAVDGCGRCGKQGAGAIRLKPGTTLIRDWGGRTWRVEVIGHGAFGFEGRRWRSLSAIARRITGTGRNGPAFFGLRAGGSHGAA